MRRTKEREEERETDGKRKVQREGAERQRDKGRGTDVERGGGVEGDETEIYKRHPAP